MNKNIESLNISNSAAIVFHHLSYLKNSWFLCFIRFKFKLSVKITRLE
jgi:hypothetical protein